MPPANAEEPSLFLSTSQTSNRADPMDLQGTLVSGDQYIFLDGDLSAVDSVFFNFDSGTYTQNENFAPYDLEGGSDDNANAWDSDNYLDGPHVITSTSTLR